MKRIILIEAEDEELVNRLADKVQKIVDESQEKTMDFDLELNHFIEQN